ncbi:hypothetical protein [Sphingobium yanoikuyae]|uniref:hypothetical protein n=1 Tax=Sphingobium yanoikuyae TaxID=13690 RepID=UPI001F39EB54|nr:hypothetical protein [Sphingobium yanoikuyae]
MQLLAGGQGEHVGDLSRSFHLDTASALGRVDRDGADQGTQLRDRFGLGFAMTGQGFRQVRDLLAIFLCDPGVQSDDRECFQVGHLLRDRVAIGAGLSQDGADLDKFVAAVGNRLDQPLNLGRCLAVAALQLRALLRHFLRSLAAALMKFADIG